MTTENNNPTPEETKPESNIIVAPEPVIEEVKIKRSEMRVKLTTREGNEIEVMIMPLHIERKQKFQNLALRESTNSQKWNGLVKRRQAAMEKLQEITVTGTDDEITSQELECERINNQLEKMRGEGNSITIEKAKLACRLPIIEGVQLTEENIDWRSCDEAELIQAADFFFS